MKAVIEKFDNGMHYVSVDKSIADRLLKGGNKRCICTVNKTISFHGAIQKRKDGNHLIYLGSKILKQLNAKKGMIIHVDFKKDDTANQFEESEVWNEVINSDPEVKAIFNTLTPGNKRSIIYLITQVKSLDKQIERSLKIAAKLKMGIYSPRLLLKQD